MRGPLLPLEHKILIKFAENKRFKIVRKNCNILECYLMLKYYVQNIYLNIIKIIS